MSAPSSVREARERIIADRAKRSMWLERLDTERTREQTSAKTREDATAARAFLQMVARSTQQSLEYHMSALVTAALAAVFPHPYQFVVRFVERRNKTECDLLLVRDGREYDPLTCTGGGVVDVVSFALRAAFWALVPRRPLIVLDEPFKFVSEGLHEACSEMLKAMSERLGVQIIMVSHLPGIISAADKVVRVDQGRVDG